MVLFNMKIFLIILLLESSIKAATPESMSVIHEKMMKLLLSCFADRLNTIITTSNFKESIDQISTNSEVIIPTILVDDKFEPSDFKPTLLRMPTFVLPAHSTTSFQTMLQTVKSSPWWHINALFFIIGTSNEECGLAAEILKQSWNMNLLSSIFMCYQENGDVMLYTYNPYTDRAPYPWKKVEYVDKTNDRWTLYVLNYIEGQKHCTNLTFDKTKFLDGYKVKGVANAKSGVEWIRNKSYHVDSLLEKHPFYGEAIHATSVFTAANVTLAVYYDHAGHFFNGKASGFLVQILNGTYDISLSSRRLLPGLSSTYPALQLPTRILTQQRNFLRPEEKILLFYKVEIRYLTAVVLLISFIFILIVYKKPKFALAAFDVLRLLLSSGLNLPFDRTSTRIFFLGVFNFIIILNATFQGNISAFLTKPERLYVDNMDDVKIYHYQIYTGMGNKEFLAEIGVKSDFITYTDIDCTEFVVNNSSAACIQVIPRMLQSAAKYNLHISQSDVFEHYLSYWCKHDWPLMKKFNDISRRYVEAGLYEYWYDHKLTIPMKQLSSNEMKETEAQYRPITLDDMTFAFQFLGAGLGLSISVFIIEIFPWKKFLRAVKTMRKKCVVYSISKFRWRNK